MSDIDLLTSPKRRLVEVRWFDDERDDGVRGLRQAKVAYFVLLRTGGTSETIQDTLAKCFPNIGIPPTAEVLLHDPCILPELSPDQLANVTSVVLLPREFIKTRLAGSSKTA